MLSNAAFSHGYLPSMLMETFIIPIIKHKKGLVTDKDNYRPIAMTNVNCKVLELLILDHLKDSLYTECDHFGVNWLIVQICAYLC